MRIVTRADFDGIVCAVLLYEALDISEPVKWAEPNDMQHRRINIAETDIIANLAYHEKCMLWFDHHVSNRNDEEFKGAFKIAPSAAGVIYQYFKDQQNDKKISAITKGFKRDYSELVDAADRIDSAQLTSEEILSPQNFPYVGIAMTISGRQVEDEPYWNRLIDLFRNHDVKTVLNDPEVKKRIRRVVDENAKYTVFLKEHTQKINHITITDFRSLDPVPTGNRFLVFPLFPDTTVNIKTRRHEKDSEKIIVSIGHSITNRQCKVNVGLLCSRFGGGGHVGAGSCSFPDDKFDKNMNLILESLLKNI